MSMSDRRQKASTRRVLFGVMVVYGAATTLVPLADSLLETAAHASVEHFDDDSPPCGIGHDALTCPLCQFVGLTFLLPPVGFEFYLQRSPPLFLTVAQQFPEVSRWFFPLGPRGPPPA